MNEVTGEAKGNGPKRRPNFTVEMAKRTEEDLAAEEWMKYHVLAGMLDVAVFADLKQHKT